MKRYKSFDSLKGISCLAVVMIHVPFPDIIEKVLGFFNYSAVPIFFMISGYCCFNQDLAVHKCRIRRQVKKTMKLFLQMIIIYGSFTIILAWYQDRIGEWASQYINIKTVRNMFLFNDYDIISGGQFWFLQVLIECYLFLYLLNLKADNKKMYRLMPLLILVYYIYEYLSNNYLHFINSKIGTIFLLNGFPSFYYGYYMAKRNQISKEQGMKEKDKLVDTVLIFFYALSVILYYVEKLLFHQIDIYSHIYYLTTMSLFAWASRNTQISFGKNIERLGRKYSMYVYCFHIIVFLSISLLSNHFDLKNNEITCYVYPIFSMIVPIIIGAFCEKMKNKMQYIRERCSNGENCV